MTPGVRKRSALPELLFALIAITLTVLTWLGYWPVAQ